MSHSRPAGPHHIDHVSIDALHRRVLSAVALGKPLTEVMTELCTQVERLAPGVICTVLAVHPDGTVSPLAARSMPPGFSEAINGQPIGPKAGSCGTAAWRGQPVEVSDIANDPLWADYRELALAFGLAACWSTPVFRAGGSVGATFALYYREARPALPVHRAMVESCVQLCQIALRHHEHELRIERLAYYDAVTGLANRNLLVDRTRQALHMVTQLGSQGALILIDLDRFRGINESLGHRAGDALLHGLGERLRQVAGPADTLARPGGDEFVLLLPNCGPLEAQQMATRLHAAIQTPNREPGHADLQLTASIGICLFPSDGVNVEALLSNAELAMYEAKHAGLAHTRFFHRAMNEALDARLRVEAALRSALDTETFVLHFQPKVLLSDSSMAGAEVLLRWTDSELGPMAPDRFIPVAEEAGLIATIDRWVLGAACAQLANWRAAGLPTPALSVNISPPLILQDDVAGLVARLMEQHGLRADELTLELTERLLLEDDEHARDQLRQLDAMGVRISLDDFGTGYSSLSYLKRLPVSELKLDRSFVRDLENDADDRALATAIIGIGQTFGLHVVAEGVETEGQRRILQEAGCELAQGWLFAAAMSAEAFAERYLSK